MLLEAGIKPRLGIPSLIRNVQKLTIYKSLGTHSLCSHELSQTVTSIFDHNTHQGVYGGGNSRFGPVSSSQTLWKILPANFGGSNPCTHEWTRYDGAGRITLIGITSAFSAT